MSWVLRVSFLALAVVAASACSGDPADPTAELAQAAEPPTPIQPTPIQPTPTTMPPPTAVPTVEIGPIAEPVRHAAAGDLTYFVMIDRFANGSTANDTGGIAGGPLDHGFEPTNIGYHHGGDLLGLTERLDYITGLGADALWITPPFRNRPVQGDGTLEGSSSSYHGYWQIDWDNVDPHFGTIDEMHNLIDTAHAEDLRVFLDVVVNHTGDVISSPASASGAYVSTSVAPYLDAQGRPFDLATAAESDEFPELNPDVSFPYPPVADERFTKSPEWLNDLTLYHNRGNTTFSGESDLLGDFFGLDDLFTEHPRVVDGMSELHARIATQFDVDGYRIDTMKHVDLAFWRAFVPHVLATTRAAGNDDFFMFGEVNAQDPILTSTYTNAGVPGSLDFLVGAALARYVGESSQGRFLADAFDEDDWYLDADGNASMQVTFIGNHDIGRMGYLISQAQPNSEDAELVARMKLGFELLLLTRGMPVIYYGDEQGFTGDGGDRLARQPMFPTMAAEYADDDNIGSVSTPSNDNFDRDHPLYRHIAELAAFRNEHPTLRSGAQRVHEVAATGFGFSRIDRDEQVEYVVLANSSAVDPVTLTVPVLAPESSYEVLRGEAQAVVVRDGFLTVEVPPLTTVVMRSVDRVRALEAPPTVQFVRPAPEAEIPTPRYRFEVESGDLRQAEVTFAVAIEGGEPQVLGVDDAPPYRIYWDNAALDPGTEVEFIATIADLGGAVATDRISVTIGPRR